MDQSNADHGSGLENQENPDESVQLPLSTASEVPGSPIDAEDSASIHIANDKEPILPTDSETGMLQAESAEGGIDVQEQDPNTSVLIHPPSSGHPFTTPLKLLPALKDIENITTPKSFSVARDSINSDVRSSPVDHHKSAQLENLAEAEEDAFDSAANDTFASATDAPSHKDEVQAQRAGELQAAATFLGVEPSDLLSAGADVVTKTAFRAQQYQGVQSELSFFKLNQELINQVQQKKFDMFQKKAEKLSEANDTLTTENEKLALDVQAKEETIVGLRAQLSSLSDKVYQLESSTKQTDSSYSEQLAAKEHEIFRLNDTINKLTRSNVESGQRLSELTKELNEVTNEKFQFKLDLSKVSNELSYVKNQKDWYEEELRSIQDKYTELIKKHDLHFLKDSNRISSLQSQTETLTSLNESLQTQTKELQLKLDKESTKCADLESKFEVQNIKYSRESNAKDDMIELLNVQLTERSDRIIQLEDYAEELKSSTAESLGSLQKDLANKEEKIISLEERLRRTEEALDSELRKETELPRLSDSAELIMQASPQGISLSTLYTEFNHIKKELALEKSQKEKLAVQLQHFVSELESKKPAIANYRNQILFYEQSMKDMLSKLESSRIDKVESEKESNRLRTRLNSYETELLSMKQLSKDLGRQLCYYLIHSKIREGDEDPLTSSEKRVIDQILAKTGNKDATMETDTDQLISDRLVNFASIIELQTKNEELLLAIRLLGKQLEDKEHESNGFEVAAVEEAREAILTLQGELDSVTIKLEAVTKERDLMKSLNGSGSGGETSKVDITVLSEANKDLKARITESERALREVQAQSAEKIRSINEKLTVANNSKEELQIQLSSVKHSVDLAESRLENAKKLLDNVRADLEYFKKEAIFWKEQASKQEGLLVKKSNELRDAEQKLASANASTKNLETEKEIWTALHQSLKDEITHLKKDKDHLNSFVFNLQSLIKERESATVDLSNKLAESVQNYHNLQDKIAEKEERILILASQSDLALKAQNTKLEQVNELSQRLLDAKNKLAEKQSLIDGLRRKLTESTVLESNTNTSRLHFDNETSILPSEYEDIKNELKLAEMQVSEFSSIAKAAEDALMKATESFDQYKSSSEERLRSLKAERDDLENEVISHKKNVEELQSLLHDMENKYMSEVQELKAKAHEYSLKASSYDTLQKDYESKIATINGDLQSQVTVNNELESNYREKLAETEQLVSEISKEKKSNADLRAEINTLTTKLETAEAELSSKEEILAEHESAKQEELATVNMKVKDLEYQYHLALNQIELNSGSSKPDEANSTEDLREVVHYLRREKDNAVAKAVSLGDEQSRLKTQLETVTSELNAARSQIARMQTMKVQLDDASRDHSRLMEQLEQLNILRESNTTLRNENKATQERVSALQVEVEKLRAQPAQSINNDTDSAVQAQELKLLKEENERLNTQLTNNEEVKNLMQRFENLKNEFKTKLTGHRNKNKELEKELAEVKASLDDSQKKLSESAKAASENAGKDFDQELQKLRAEFDAEKSALAESLKTQYEQTLQKELEAAKTAGSSANITEAKLQAEKEWRAKMEASNLELSAKFAKELDSKVQQQVTERLAQSTSENPDTEQVRKAVVLQYEDKIKALNEEFEKRLTKEVTSVEKAVDKKYEFKIRVLNRKVERLEKELQEKQSSSTPKPRNNQPQAKPKAGNATNGVKGEGATNPAADNNRKRPFGKNNQQPAKKAKE